MVRNMSSKMAVGIVTFNRPGLYEKCVRSIPEGMDIYVSITGDPYDLSLHAGAREVFQFTSPSCVGKGKNKLFQMMMRDGVEHIFIVEDDMMVRDRGIFEKYVDASYETGLLHMNYGYHGPMNLRDGKPAPKVVVNYTDKVKIALNMHCVGAFSYYRRKVIERVGCIDERFVNCWDHVEHTYRIISAGFTTPFWWFADVAGSFNYIEDCDATLEKSVIRRNGGEWMGNMKDGLAYFKWKHGVQPFEIPIAEPEEVENSLRRLKQTVAT
jgi:hypothetical protein